MAATADVYSSRSALPGGASNGQVAFVVGSDLVPGTSGQGRSAAVFVYSTALLAVGVVLTARSVLTPTPGRAGRATCLTPSPTAGCPPSTGLRARE